MALSKSEAFSEVDAARARLLEVLEGLSDQQWDQQSFCDGWRVREVAGHVAGGSTTNGGKFLLGMFKSGFNYDKVSAKLAKASGSRPTSEILEDFRSIVGSRKLPPTVSPQQFLVDCVTHSLDICWPLDITMEIPDRQMIEVLDKAVTLGQPFLCRERAEGLRLVVPELDWSSGVGPEVRGSAQAVLLGITGRGEALDQLEGDGLEVLRSRL